MNFDPGSIFSNETQVKVPSGWMNSGLALQGPDVLNVFPSRRSTSFPP